MLLPSILAQTLSITTISRSVLTRKDVNALSQAVSTASSRAFDSSTRSSSSATTLGRTTCKGRSEGPQLIGRSRVCFIILARFKTRTSKTSPSFLHRTNPPSPQPLAVLRGRPLVHSDLSRAGEVGLPFVSFLWVLILVLTHAGVDRRMYVDLVLVIYQCPTLGAIWPSNGNQTAFANQHHFNH